MGLIYDMRKNILKRRVDLANKAKKLREGKLKQEEELEMLREKIRSAKRLNLTPKQKEMLIRRRKLAMQRQARLRQASKVFIKKISKFADNVNREFEQDVKKARAKGKSRGSARVKKVIARRKVTKRRRA
jgi:GTPase SAR1 family protein